MSARTASVALPLVGQLALAWQGLDESERAKLRTENPLLAQALRALAEDVTPTKTPAARVSFASVAVAPLPPASGASLAAALDLADNVSPLPRQAHVALQILRKALADARAMTVDELRREAVACAERA